MVYGLEAMLPTELEYKFPRVQTYQPNQAEQARWDVIDTTKILLIHDDQNLSHITKKAS
jgi:catalase